MAFNNLNYFLTKIVHSCRLKMNVFVCLKTKMSVRLSYVLKHQGFIVGYSCFKFGKKVFIKLFLKYYNSFSTITKIKLISKPSKRIFLNSDSVSKFNINTGLLILHTRFGLLSHKQCQIFSTGGEAVLFVC
jgi:small subunit ribosomal protein S8